jgi:hypothetical protein
MKRIKKFSYKNVEMLMASKAIAESFKANLSELSATRTDWTEQYAADLLLRIDNAIENYLGIDSKKDQRNATSVVVSIQVPARRDVAYFKTQIEDDFKKEPDKRDEILKTLGYAKHLREVQKGNQEALVQLLYTFKTNMTDDLRSEIIARGLNKSLIDNLTGYADTFKQANVRHENFKMLTKEITKEAADAFNDIYDEIIGICKKASSYFQFETLKKEQFTFTRVIETSGGTKKAPAEAVEEVQV